MFNLSSYLFIVYVNVFVWKCIHNSIYIIWGNYPLFLIIYTSFPSLQHYQNLMAPFTHHLQSPDHLSQYLWPSTCRNKFSLHACHDYYFIITSTHFLLLMTCCSPFHQFGKEQLQSFFCNIELPEIDLNIRSHFSIFPSFGNNIINNVWLSNPWIEINI